MPGFDLSKLLSTRGIGVRRAAFLGVIVLVVVVLGAGLTTVARQRGTSAPGVLLEAAASVGPLPFVALLQGPVPSLVPAFELVTDTEGASSEDGDARTTSTTATGTTVAAIRGDRVGLYGGTTDDATCDRDALVEFLEENPRHAAAWAAVHGIDAGEIRQFIADLTPVFLRLDTRVTNHGFEDGRATARQSVLQAGTSVLVDDEGVPRARCACGNPLLPPTPAGTNEFDGEPWDEFDPARLVHVTAGRSTGELVIMRLDTGELAARPTGTDGDHDRAVTEVLGTEVENTTTTTSSTSSPPTSTSTTTSDTTSVPGTETTIASSVAPQGATTTVRPGTTTTQRGTTPTSASSTTTSTARATTTAPATTTTTTTRPTTTTTTTTTTRPTTTTTTTVFTVPPTTPGQQRPTTDSKPPSTGTTSRPRDTTCRACTTPTFTRPTFSVPEFTLVPGPMPPQPIG